MHLFDFHSSSLILHFLSLSSKTIFTQLLFILSMDLQLTLDNLNGTCFLKYEFNYLPNSNFIRVLLNEAPNTLYLALILTIQDFELENNGKIF